MRIKTPASVSDLEAIWKESQHPVIHELPCGMPPPDDESIRAWRMARRDSERVREAQQEPESIRSGATVAATCILLFVLTILFIGATIAFHLFRFSK